MPERKDYMGLIIIGLILTIIGVIMVYDARLITKKYFGFGDQNQATMGIKILGFVLIVIGGFILYFNI